MRISQLHTPSSSSTLKRSAMASEVPERAAKRLKLLALHSFRTSAAIFREQMKRSGLDEKLEDLVEFVYIDAPNEAHGPPPPDVAPFFPPPHWEWWNAVVDEKTGKSTYEGAENSMAYLDEVFREQGPFDGCWAFSQGTLLASIVISLQQQHKRFQNGTLQLAVLIGGFYNREKLRSNKQIQEVFQPGKLLQIPSLHIIGDRDSIRKFSQQLMEEYKDPILLTHPRGHNVPTLDSESLETLKTFLKKHLALKSEAASAIANSDSRL